MPNWVDNEVTITGEPAVLAEIKEQLARPYQTRHTKFDKETKEVYWQDAEETGEFLMWNIIRPLDLETYYSDKKNVVTPASADFASIAAEFNQNVAEDNTWYYWNIRNWGTKWEISEATCNLEGNTLGYWYQTAWSPNEQALNHLAKMFPSVTILARFIEEGMGYAGEAYWEDGEQAYARDLDINHATLLDFNGECWVCQEGDADLMADYGCAEYKRAVETLG